MLHLHFPILEVFFLFFLSTHSKENYLADATQYLKHSSNLKESHKTTTTTESKEKKKLTPTLEKNQTRTTTARNEGGKMQSSAKPTNFARAFDYVRS